ncbi:g5424 [Coccomyxa elongata]
MKPKSCNGYQILYRKAPRIDYFFKRRDRTARLLGIEETQDLPSAQIETFEVTGHDGGADNADFVESQHTTESDEAAHKQSRGMRAECLGFIEPFVRNYPFQLHGWRCIEYILDQMRAAMQGMYKAKGFCNDLEQMTAATAAFIIVGPRIMNLLAEVTEGQPSQAETLGLLYSMDSDGDPICRQVMDSICCKSLNSSSKLYHLSKLTLLDMRVGPHEITANFDYKHISTHLRGAFINREGITVTAGDGTQSVITPQDPGFCLDRFLVAASRWVLPKRLPHGRSGRGVRPTAVCVGASTAGGDTGLPFSREGLVGYSRLAGYCSAAWLLSFRLDRCVPMAPARLHAGIHRRRAAGLNADDDATP